MGRQAIILLMSRNSDFLKKIFYLFMREREKASERAHMKEGSSRGRIRSRFPTEQGARHRGLVPGPRDHELS